MNNNNATINGLMDGISVLENDNKRYDYHEAVVLTDMLYNNHDTGNDHTLGGITELHYEDIQTISEYCVTDFGEAITLTSDVTYSLPESYEEI